VQTQDEQDASAEDDLDDPEPASSPEPWGFWPALLGASALQLALTWFLNAIPPRTGEAASLRWLRALTEHPWRSPLGLALAWLGLAQLVRAVFNRARRA